VYDLASPSSREDTGLHFIGAFMNFPMTLATKRDQVVLGIRALMAPESLVMNFDCGERAAGLAAPTIVVRLELAIPRLPGQFDGLTIAQLSDFHFESSVPSWL
jgi:hypothetical protein